MQTEEEAAGRLIEYLHAMQGQLLWSFEDSNLNKPHLASSAALQCLVQSLVRTMQPAGQHGSAQRPLKASVVYCSKAVIPG